MAQSMNEYDMPAPPSWNCLKKPKKPSNQRKRLGYALIFTKPIVKAKTALDGFTSSY
jgi:hypothetical protein